VSGVAGEIQELRRELQRLRNRVEQLERENAELRSENARLREALEEARRAGKRQAAPFSRGEKKAEPRKPGRKAGSAYGSQARRAVPKQIDKKVTVDCPLLCPHCGGGVRMEGKSSQYQTDIPPVEPTSTEFEIHYGRCIRCHRRVQGRDARQTSDASGAVGGVQIGPNTIAIAAHLNKTCGTLV
jgi:transposase